MKIYVYSDESGVLDKKHNDYYIFGGVLFTSEDDRDNYSRKYIAAERNVRISEPIPQESEVKACYIKPKSKRKLYSCVKNTERFGVVISQKKLTSDELFSNKKSKQRYLDWAYKMAVKKKFEYMIANNQLNPKEVEAIYFLVDEHSTATNGWYELKESLEKEFKIGMWNFDYMRFYPPLFPNIKAVNLQYCNSSKKTLIRAADIIANHLYFVANTNGGKVPAEEKLHIYYHPENRDC